MKKNITFDTHENDMVCQTPLSFIRNVNDLAMDMSLTHLGDEHLLNVKFISQIYATIKSNQDKLS